MRARLTNQAVDLPDLVALPAAHTEHDDRYDYDSDLKRDFAPEISGGIFLHSVTAIANGRPDGPNIA